MARVYIFRKYYFTLFFLSTFAAKDPVVYTYDYYMHIYTILLFVVRSLFLFCAVRFFYYYIFFFCLAFPCLPLNEFIRNDCFCYCCFCRVIVFCALKTFLLHALKRIILFYPFVYVCICYCC